MSARKAILYRMVLPDHICPYGMQALQMLGQSGFDVEERILSTHMEADAFMHRLGVESTPQVFIEGLRIGGCEELQSYLAETEAAA